MTLVYAPKLKEKGEMVSKLTQQKSDFAESEINLSDEDYYRGANGFLQQASFL